MSSQVLQHLQAQLEETNRQRAAAYEQHQWDQFWSKHPDLAPIQANVQPLRTCARGLTKDGTIRLADLEQALQIVQKDGLELAKQEVFKPAKPADKERNKAVLDGYCKKNYLIPTAAVLIDLSQT